MDNTKFVSNFIKSYREFLISKNFRHGNIKHFNNCLKKYSHFLVHPFHTNENKEQFKLLTGFSNAFKIYKKNDKEALPSAAKQIGMFKCILTVSKDFGLSETVSKDFDSSETVAIPTSEIEPLPIRKVEWSELVNAPKLAEADFDLLQDSFLEYFNLDEYAYQADSNESFRFGEYFREEANKPEGLELREVWHDTCQDDKHGEVQTLVFWKEEFIGWISCSGRYLTSSTASTVNLPKWTELMDTIYANSGYKPGRNVNGVSVYDMNKDDVDDVAYVPGVSTVNYDD